MAIGRTTRSGAAATRATRVTRLTVDEGSAPRAKEVGGPIVPAARPQQPAAPVAARKPAPGPVARPAPTPGPQWPAPTPGPQWPAPGPVLGTLSPDARAGWMAPWPSGQVIARLRERGEVYTNAAYEMGEALRELSRPERYRDELGCGSLEELLVVHGLPCRSTAHKFISVVTTFSLAEVKALGGMEKCYWIIRGEKLADPAADPRRALEPGARIMGLDVQSASARQLRMAQRKERVARGPDAGGPAVGGPSGPTFGGPAFGGPSGPTFGGPAFGGGRPVRGPAGATGPADLPDPGAASRAAARLRSATRRAAIVGRIRVHHENGRPCVTGHFDAANAGRLAEILRIGLAHAPPAPS